MNSTIKKTFYTSSTESLFLRYKKIFKEAVKLGCTNQFKIFVKLYYEKPSALGGNVSPCPPPAPLHTHTHTLTTTSTTTFLHPSKKAFLSP